MDVEAVLVSADQGVAKGRAFNYNLVQFSDFGLLLLPTTLPEIVEFFMLMVFPEFFFEDEELTMDRTMKKVTTTIRANSQNSSE